MFEEGPQNPLGKPRRDHLLFLKDFLLVVKDWLIILTENLFSAPTLSHLEID
jgi:hypothetical protein